MSPERGRGHCARDPDPCNTVPRAQTDPDCRRAPSVRQGGTQLAELRFVSVRLACEEGEHAAGWERDCKRSLGRSGVTDQALSETAGPQLCPGTEHRNPKRAA